MILVNPNYFKYNKKNYACIINSDYFCENFYAKKNSTVLWSFMFKGKV